MAWSIEWDERAVKDAKKLDENARRRIVGYLRERVATEEDPRRFGKALTASKSGLWRYRVGGYRTVCRIEDERLIARFIREANKALASKALFTLLVNNAG